MYMMYEEAVRQISTLGPTRGMCTYLCLHTLLAYSMCLRCFLAVPKVLIFK
jgi:hypothetical protein